MGRNERLRALFSLRKEAIVARKKPIGSENTSDSLDGAASQSSYLRTKSIGSSPSTGNFFKLHESEPNNISRPNGFASFIMMGFITFFFETLFIGLSYLIFK